MAVNVQADIGGSAGQPAPVTLSEFVTPDALYQGWQSGGGLVVGGAGAKALWFHSRLMSPVAALVFLRGAPQVPLSFIVEPGERISVSLPVACDTIRLAYLPLSGAPITPGVPPEGSDYNNGQTAVGWLLVTGVDSPAVFSQSHFKPPNMNRYGAGSFSIAASGFAPDVLSSTILPRTICGLDIYNTGATLLYAAWCLKDPAGNLSLGFVDSGTPEFPIFPNGAESMDIGPFSVGAGSGNSGTPHPIVTVRNPSSTTAGSYSIKVRGY